MKLLLVEDEKDLNKILTKLLQKKDYQVDVSYNGLEALQLVRKNTYDAIIMDVMMPEMNGYKAVEEIRALKITTPIIMLTSRDSVNDKIKGLNIGADDYLVKPFKFDELLARLNAMIRRNYGNVTNKIVIGDLVLDTYLKTVHRNGKLVKLTAKEYRVLELLLQNRNRVLSREQIRSRVWEYDYECESNIIDVIIKNIRKKIETKGSTSIIHTRRGLGYVITETEE